MNTCKACGIFENIKVEDYCLACYSVPNLLAVLSWTENSKSLSDAYFIVHTALYRMYVRHGTEYTPENMRDILYQPFQFSGMPQRRFSSSIENRKKEYPQFVKAYNYLNGEKDYYTFWFNQHQIIVNNILSNFDKDLEITHFHDRNVGKPKSWGNLPIRSTANNLSNSTYFYYDKTWK